MPIVENSQPAADPTVMSRALRDPEAPAPYRLLDRWADAWAGVRDGRSDAMTLAEVTADRSLCADAWLTRNRHLYAERDHQEFLAAQALAALIVAQWQAAKRAATHASTVAEDAKCRRSRMPETPTSEDLARRGPAEVDDNEQVIESRRRAAHAQMLATLDSAVTTAAAEAAGRAEEAVRLRAQVLSLFQITRRRSDRLREHHQRRAATFMRSYRRTLVRRGCVQAPSTYAEADIPAPAWTEQDCPWLTEDAALAAT